MAKTLFFKDGPLTLRGQYSKLAIQIRRLFEYCKQKDRPIYVVGQEKTGAFVDYLEYIGKEALRILFSYLITNTTHTDPAPSRTIGTIWKTSKLGK